MRPENKKMKEFLASHGIACNPKWLKAGSLKRCWRLHDRKQHWTVDLQNKLNSLGFVDFDGSPLSQYSGNGGMFSVFVRGHEEFLVEEKPQGALLITN